VRLVRLATLVVQDAMQGCAVCAQYALTNAMLLGLVVSLADPAELAASSIALYNGSFR